MKFTEYLLFGVMGWTAIGALGVAISVRRGQRAEAVRNLAWLAAVLGGYLIALLLVSALQRQKTVAIGQNQCYGEMCFAVTGVDEVPGLVAGDPSRVLRITIRVSNHGRSADAERLIRAYLVDSKGRTWEPMPGLSGNRLTGRVAGGSQMLSQPMFRVAPDSTGLGLVFTHGNWQKRRLVIADSDSLGHRATTVDLDR
jgi:hypothetical protein